MSTQFPDENVEFELSLDIEYTIIIMNGSITDADTVGKRVAQKLDALLDGEYDIYIVKREVE